MLECYTNDKQFEAQIIMSEIILRNQSATMQVNTMGGYIDSLILKGRKVLFPKTSVHVAMIQNYAAACTFTYPNSDQTAKII